MDNIITGLVGILCLIWFVLSIIFLFVLLDMKRDCEKENDVYNCFIVYVPEER